MSYSKVFIFCMCCCSSRFPRLPLSHSQDVFWQYVGKKVKNKNVKPEGYEGWEEFANRQAWKFLRDDEVGALQA